MVGNVRRYENLMYVFVFIAEDAQYCSARPSVGVWIQWCWCVYKFVVFHDGTPRGFDVVVFGLCKAEDRGRRGCRLK